MIGRQAPFLVAALLVLGAAAGPVGGCGGDDELFGATESSGAGVGGGAGGGVALPPLEPAPAGMRRLVARQYVNSVAALFGDAVAGAASPPDDLALHGFTSIGAAEIAIPESAVETYEASARAVGAALVADPAALSAIFDTSCAEGPTQRQCFADFVTSTGKVAWRRPLDPEEVETVVDIAVAAATEYGDYEQGIIYAVTALLQAPEFLYIVEVGEVDPEDATRNRLTPFELVTRISYFLTDSPPTAAMLDQAEAGAYASADDLRQLARTLLDRPEAKSALASFFSELYRLEQLSQVAKDETLFPQWSEAMSQGLYDSTQYLLADVIWSRDADAREIFNADYAFVNDITAPIYGVSVDTTAFQKVTMPASQARKGLMGQPSMMSLLAAADGTSPTRRGVFIRRVLMCDIIPPPDPNAELELPDNDPGDPKTKKELLEEHFENPACAGCHSLFDPAGLAHESFDGIGRHRTQDENGLAIDTAGEQQGLGTYETPGDVSDLLAQETKVADCMVTNIFRHSMGHLETDGEAGALIELNRSFADGGYSMQSLMAELVAHPAFRLVGDPK